MITIREEHITKAAAEGIQVNKKRNAACIASEKIDGDRETLKVIIEKSEQYREIKEIEAEVMKLSNEMSFEIQAMIEVKAGVLVEVFNKEAVESLK